MMQLEDYLFLSLSLVAGTVFFLSVRTSVWLILLSLTWLVIIGSLAKSDFFRNTEVLPPRFLLVIFGSIMLSILLFRSGRLGKPGNKAMLAIHALRVPVEIALYRLYSEGLIPEEMTFNGWNFDILFGISAVLLLLLITLTNKQIPPKLLIIWNLLGMCSLSTIVVISILAAPSPIQLFAHDSPNIGVQLFPYVYLPGFIVPVVFVCHLLSIRHQRMNR